MFDRTAAPAVKKQGIRETPSAREPVSRTRLVVGGVPLELEARGVSVPDSLRHLEASYCSGLVPPVRVRIVKRTLCKLSALGWTPGGTPSRSLSGMKRDGLRTSPLLQDPEVVEAMAAVLAAGEEGAYILNDSFFFGFSFPERRSDLFYVDVRDDKQISDHVLTVCLQFFPKHGRLLLHASALVRNAQALVFTGPSGSGKTTVARKAAGRGILSDDIVAVSGKGSGFRAHGTPFGTISTCLGPVPVGGIFFLRKARRFALRPVTVAESLARLWAEHRALWTFMLPPTRKRVFLLLEELLCRIPRFEMAFTRDGADMEVLDRALAGARGQGRRTLECG